MKKIKQEKRAEINDKRENSLRRKLNKLFIC